MKIVRQHFNIIDSTNTWAKQHAQELDQEILTLITASEQTAGRGRFKRRWESPAAVNIYATFCLFVDYYFSGLGHIPQLLALSAAETIESLGLNPTLKWPNDLLINGKKIAGILCETTVVSQRLCIVCGIGLNVNMPLEKILEIDRPATSLLIEGQQKYEVEKVLDLLTNQFILHLNQFKKSGFTSFFESFKHYSYLKLGQKIRFHDNQNLLEGYFETLNADGSMTLRLLNGELKTFHAGEFID